MGSPMRAKMRTVVKSPPTGTAFVGLLSRVGPLVPNEAGAVVKGFPTLTALERFFSSVGPLMLNKV